jgi:hypothetical protein
MVLRRQPRAAIAALGSVLVVLAAAPPTRATDFQLTDVRSLGMGGALRASAIGTSSLVLNPAGLTQSKLYHIETTYMFDDKYKMHYTGASVVDSVTSRLGMGLGYTFRWVGKSLGKQKLQAHNVVLGLSYAIIPRLSLGINLHYVRTTVHEKHKLDSEVETPDYAAIKTEPASWDLDGTAPGDNQHPYGRDLNAFTMDAGLTLRIIDQIGIAVVGYNLTNLKSPFAPMMLGMGAFAEIAIIHISFDVLLDWDSAKRLFGTSKPVSPKFLTGLEAFLGDHYPLRAGYSYDDVTRSHTIHWGAGYIARQGSIEAGFSYEVNDGLDDRNDFRFMISLKYFAF